MIHAIVDRIRAIRGADVIQVRNHALTAQDLLTVVRWYAERHPRVIVNSRWDVALCGGAAGVHLPAGAVAPGRIRLFAPAGFSVGVSCHSRDELERADAEGADYAYLSPVFAPLSKQNNRAPLGLAKFTQMIAGLTLPVLALGGVTLDRIDDCRHAGAAGIAGIGLVDLLETPDSERIATPG